jgi:hypothetical protein
MKALLTLKKESGISFVRDAEALCCLLFDILAFFEKPHTEIVIGEINCLARALGYQGSINAIRRVLLEKNFLTEVERGVRFSLTHTNRMKITEFCKSQPPSFTGLKLTNVEHAYLYGSSGVQGSVGEAFLARVMGQLAILNTILSEVPRLEIKVISDAAKHMAGDMCMQERVKGYLEATNHLCREFDAIELQYGNDSKEFENISNRYIDAYNQIHTLVDMAQEENMRYQEALGDAAILRMLKDVRVLLLQVTASFSKREEEI